MSNYAAHARRAVFEARDRNRQPVKVRQQPKPKREREPPPLVLPPGKTLVEAIIDIQGNCCLLCGTPLSVVNPHTGFRYNIYSKRRPTYEHVVPRARGGVNHGNRLVAHKFCNEAKADRMPTGCELVWLAVVNARLQIRC